MLEAKHITQINLDNERKDWYMLLKQFLSVSCEIVCLERRQESYFKIKNRSNTRETVKVSKLNFDTYTTWITETRFWNLDSFFYQIYGVAAW